MSTAPSAGTTPRLGSGSQKPTPRGSQKPTPRSGSSMRTPSSTLLFTMRMNDAFGGATSFILERLHEMGTGRGCQLNWGGDDGEVPDAPPALQNGIWSELWFHSSNIWNLQQR